MQTLQITEITHDDPRMVAAYVDVANAVRDADAPWEHPATVAGATGMLKRGWDGEPPRAFAAQDGEGRVTGLLEVWTTEWDNTDLAWLWVVVHPDHRRRGIGSALMEHAFAVARSMGRTKVGIDGWESDTTAGFAHAHGFTWASQAINRRQHLAELDLAHVQELYNEAATHAAGYELMRLSGRTPDDMMDAMSVMVAAINDAPLDDLDLEDEVFPPERIRAYEDTQLANGHRLYRLVARHQESGDLAGHTVVAVEAERPTIGHQHDTSVLEDHRGHRLGLLLKAGMVLWLAEEEPQLATVDTWNAESNDFMISVNEMLGYRPMGRGMQYQRKLE